MTNVGFTALFQPFGVPPAEGYEIHYFDRRQNEMVGGSPFGYRERGFAWKDMFHSSGRNLVAKLAMYATPGRTARWEVRQAEKTVLSSRLPWIMAYVGSTDGFQHVRGDRATVRFLLDLDRNLVRLRERHREETGRELRLVLFSDHGNGREKVRGASGFRRLLRGAGLRVVRHLECPDDVAAPTFGLVNYGAVFLRPPRAETAALALVRHEAVDLVAWRSGHRKIEVVSRTGRATIRWRRSGDRRRYAYEDQAGDPLLLADARGRLSSRERLDREGFAREGDWFEETALLPYPDPLRRLVDALAGYRIRNRAAILFSLAPNRAWGLRTARAGSWLQGGKMEGTHGGLDRDSTMGFLLTDDPALAPPPVVRADRALAPFAASVGIEQPVHPRPKVPSR
jgi:hypothetical protein